MHKKQVCSYCFSLHFIIAMFICKMESELVFFFLWTLFGVQGITQKVFPQPAYRTWLDAESSCRKDRLGLLVNLDSLTKDTTFDLEVSVTDSDQYWTGGYRLGLFYWKYGCFTSDSAAIFMTGNLKEIGDTNSVSECARFCGEERQWVALVKRFCYCLFDVDEKALVSSRCPSSCPGDRMDSCGSDQAMSIYKILNKTEIVDDITHQSIGDNQMCVFIMSDAGVIRWKVDNCTQQKIVLCQNLTTSGIEFVSPHRTPKSWMVANEDCQRGNMTLAVVTQNDVKKSPIDKLPQNVPVWVALRRHDLFYWTSGDIKDDPADCLAVQKDNVGNLVRSWFPCIDQFKYVCLSDNQPPTVESAVIGTPAPTTASTAETTTMPTTWSTTKQMTTQPTTMPTTQPTSEQMTTQPSTMPTTEQMTTKPTTMSTTEQMTTKPTTMPTTELMTTQPTIQPTTEQMTTKPTTSSTTEQMTTKPTTMPTTEPITTQPTTEQITTKPTTMSLTDQLTTKPTTMSNKEQSTTQPTTQPTTMPMPEQMTTKPTTQPTTEQMTTKPTTMSTTEQMTTKPTTQPTTEQMTSKPTTQPTTKQMTTQPTTISTTEQITTQTTIPTTEQITTQTTAMQTTQLTTEQITTKPTTTQPTTKQITTKPTTQPTTEQITTTTQPTTEQITTKPTTIQTTETTMSTTQPTTEQMTTQQTTIPLTEQMKTKSITISTTESTTTKETTIADTEIVTTVKIKPITPIVESKSFLPEKSTVFPTQPIATESNAFTNTSNGLPSSGNSSEQSDHVPTTELILVILIFVALVLLGVFIFVQWAVRRRKRKSLRSNRRTSKEITFNGEDEMLIRSFRPCVHTATLSPKPMPRIDIDTGSLLILANIPENENKLHRSDDTLDIPWIDASMNTLDNVSVSRDTEARFDTVGTKALSAPELDRIGVDSDDEDDVSHPSAMRTFSKQNEPILESEI